MRTEVMTVTPAMAEKMIKASTGVNRPLKTQIVRQYANDMASGKWKENGESIILDDNGNILDGQHRLHAVVMSKMTFRFSVTRGVDASSYDTIDTGTKRSGRDVLYVAGYKDACNLAAVLSAIHRYKTFGFQDTRSPASNEKGRPRFKNDFLELVSLYPGAQDSARYIHSRAKNCFAFRPSSFAACMHYVLGEKNSVMRDAFFEAIYEKKYVLGRKDPVRKLQAMHEHQDKIKAMAQSVRYRAEVWEELFAEFRHSVRGLTPGVYLKTNQAEWTDSVRAAAR